MSPGHYQFQSLHVYSLNILQLALPCLMQIMLFAVCEDRVMVIKMCTDTFDMYIGKVETFVKCGGF